MNRIVEALWQCAIFQAALIRIFFSATVDDGRFVDRSAHCPIKHSVLFKENIGFLVKSSRASIRANAANQLFK